MKLKFTQKVSDFINNHSVEISDGVRKIGSIVGGIVSIGVGMAILKMNGIDISLNDVEGETVEVKSPPPQLSANELAENAIEKIMERADDEIFDSGRLAAAKDIFDIAMKEGVTTAKTKAINVLSAISSDCVYASTRGEIGGYIKNIAMSF